MTPQIVLGLDDKFEEVRVDLARLMDGRLLVQGASGAGKSWLLRRLLECSWGQVQQIVIDIEGEFATLTESFGHVVVPSAEAMRVGGHALALAARDRRFSMILDLSDEGRPGQAAIAADFLRGLIDAPAEHWSPCLVVVDEAHVLAPIGVSASALDDRLRKESVAAMADLMGRGRKRGLIAALATQRMAGLAKSVAASAANVAIGRNVLDIDAERAAGLVGIKRSTALRRLRRLPAGTFLVLGPALADVPTRVAVGPVETTHGGAAPAFEPPPAVAPEDALAGIAALPEADDPLPDPGPVAHKGRRHWTEEEDAILRAGYAADDTTEAIQARLPRAVSISGMAARAHKLGLKRPSIDWTEEEREIVREGYAANLTRSEIAARIRERLGRERTEGGVGWIAGELGLNKAPKPWTDAEVAELRRAAEAGEKPAEVAARLDRPLAGVNAKCYTLRIHFRHPWTDADRAALEAGHAAGDKLTEVAARLGRPYVNVAKMAEKAGLSFARQYRPLRVNILQAVKELERHHRVEPTRGGSFVIDGKHSFKADDVVKRLNVLRRADGLPPVELARSP